MVDGEPCPSERETRIERHGFDQQGGSLVDLGVKADARGCLVRELLMTQQQVVRFEILSRRLGELRLLLRLERHAQRLRDFARQLTLDGEDVLQLTVVALGPEMLVQPRIYQLRSDTHLIA